ncbi:ABC transporter permease [Alteribacter natronophilus]|uniref:ABC transporter permease n=1 Tax=Alteribacter natronophilus TaxID=2583810 RepID=UPI00110EE4DC|nr:ABC transporter permease [Alteribacter natronophilus]TMW71572.1 ABC transporter permease [Alteribacter natronophilus]
MRNSMKVAKWEIKRNMMNKSYFISLFLTPAIFIFFFTVPGMFTSDPADDELLVYVDDRIGVWEQAEEHISRENMNIITDSSFESEDEILRELEQYTEDAVIIQITEERIQSGAVPVYLSEDVDEMAVFQFNALEQPLRQLQLENLGLDETEAALASAGVSLTPVSAESETEAVEEAAADPLERLVPGLFAGAILFAIMFTGMMIFQSASQEKKEKVSEMVLSSVTPSDLMQGKIMGYFVLGIVQVLFWAAVALPLVQWQTDIPVFDYLFVPELALLLLIAIAGYLMFAAIFVSLGATAEDVNASSNFQGIIMMLPFLPFVFIGPVLSDPSGTLAQVASFIPITSPAILLLRLSVIEEWPWVELILALLVLFGSILIIMKLAGKIFKTGILMYGKNATPKEILKWIRQ